MLLLRRYQLDIIFLFFALSVLTMLGFYGLEYLGADPHVYEWYIAGPIVLFYFACLWNIRSKIDIKNRRKLTGKTLFYWLALGTILFESYATPLPATSYWTINVLFLVFTLYLADSYWDFKQMTVNNLFEKKEVNGN